jgi:hypothetical protein
MLYDLLVSDFAGKSFKDSATRAENSEQGVLLKPKVLFVKGREANSVDDQAPYKATIGPTQASILTDGTYQVTVDIPVLHCECEGSRISDILGTLETDAFGISGSGFCDFTFVGIPVGSVVCFIAQAVSLPFTLGPAIAAWFLASDGNPDDARTDPNGGELKIGDILVVTGRWVYDAGHTGWNELHPVKTIQKIDPDPAAAPADVVKRWCDLLAPVPPPDATPATMTPAQLATALAQQQPANQWTLHPAVDGCQGSIPPQPPALPLH